MSPTLGGEAPHPLLRPLSPEVGSDRTPFRCRGSRPLAGRHGYRYPRGRLRSVLAAARSATSEPP